MTWRELYYGPLGYKVRWRIGGFNADGQPYNLDLERFESRIEEWVPIPNHNVRDAFCLGLMAAREMREQRELAI